jgi:hypothetical protein
MNGSRYIDLLNNVAIPAIKQFVKQKIIDIWESFSEEKCMKMISSIAKKAKGNCSKTRSTHNEI